jgi:hypothetical protein
MPKPSKCFIHAEYARFTGADHCNNTRASAANNGKNYYLPGLLNYSRSRFNEYH